MRSSRVPLYKIASYELTHEPLLRHIAAQRKPMIVSTGAADAAEVVNALPGLASCAPPLPGRDPRDTGASRQSVKVAPRRRHRRGRALHRRESAPGLRRPLPGTVSRQRLGISQPLHAAAPSARRRSRDCLRRGSAARSGVRHGLTAAGSRAVDSRRGEHLDRACSGGPALARHP